MNLSAQELEAFDPASWVYRAPSNVALGADYLASTTPPAVSRGALNNVRVIAPPGPPAQAPKVDTTKATAAKLAKVAAAVVLGYHGWKRSGGSKLWTVGWAALGAVAPVLGGMVAVSQGFGRRKKD